MKWVMMSLETYFNDGSNKATQLPCVGIQHSVVCDVDIPGKTPVCWCTELGMTRWCQGLHKPFHQEPTPSCARSLASEFGIFPLYFFWFSYTVPLVGTT